MYVFYISFIFVVGNGERLMVTKPVSFSSYVLRYNNRNRLTSDDTGVVTVVR